MREGVTVGFGKAANVNNSGGKSGSGETGVNGVIHAAFLAIAPVDAPRYVVYVQIENGRDGAGVGAQTAGEILRAAFETLG
jgi:peptidoglycan glycosyltransferase